MHWHSITPIKIPWAKTEYLQGKMRSLGQILKDSLIAREGQQRYPKRVTKFKVSYMVNLPFAPATMPRMTDTKICWCSPTCHRQLSHAQQNHHYKVANPREMRESLSPIPSMCAVSNPLYSCLNDGPSPDNHSYNTADQSEENSPTDVAMCVPPIVPP